MPEQTVPGMRYSWTPAEEKYGRAIERLEDELQRSVGRVGWGARLAAVLREYAEGCSACNGSGFVRYRPAERQSKDDYGTVSCSSCATRTERALHALAGWDRAQPQRHAAASDNIQRTGEES